MKLEGLKDLIKDMKEGKRLLNTPQGSGSYLQELHTGEIQACALGYVVYAKKGESALDLTQSKIEEYLRDTYPCLKVNLLPLPVGVTSIYSVGSLLFDILHLNDHEGWLVEEIVEYLESLEGIPGV